MSTPHNQANIGEIAKIVLFPGDPLRAKYIAETFLEDVVQFNSVRNMYGYTGTYKGKKISVMGSGMGMPSLGIYAYELFSQYGVEAIIRIGSAGSYVEDIKIRDVVVVDSAYTESTFARVMDCDGIDIHVNEPDKELTQMLLDSAEQLDIPVKTGRIHSSDVFYHIDESYRKEVVDEQKCVGVEMEAFALFHIANKLGKKGACILTMSDSFVSPEKSTAEERQNSFTKMMQVALEAAVKI